MQAKFLQRPKSHNMPCRFTLDGTSPGLRWDLVSVLYIDKLTTGYVHYTHIEVMVSTYHRFDLVACI